MSDKFLITRRSFLKVLGITGVAVNLYPFDLAEAAGWPDFNPEHQYGDDPFHLTDHGINRFDPLMKATIDEMDKGIKATIPPKYRKHVEYHIVNPKPGKSDPLGQRGVCYWKYKPRGKGGVFIK